MSDMAEIIRELEPFVIELDPTIPGRPPLYFEKAEQNAVDDAERRMGIQFPPQLREFYQKVGHGSFNGGRRGAIFFDNYNQIVPPSTAASMYLQEETDEDITLFWKDDMAPGDLPFFDLGDSFYLALKPHSEQPDAVWYPLHNKKLAEDLAEFLDRLLDDLNFIEKIVRPT